MRLVFTKNGPNDFIVLTYRLLVFCTNLMVLLKPGGSDIHAVVETKVSTSRVIVHSRLEPRRVQKRTIGFRHPFQRAIPRLLKWQPPLLILLASVIDSLIIFGSQLLQALFIALCRMHGS